MSREEIERQIPLHTMSGLRDYVENKTPKGDFLAAMLSNDLKRTCGHADDQNKHAIFTIMMWLYNYAPCGCWGSEENYLKWIGHWKEPTPVVDGNDELTNIVKELLNYSLGGCNWDWDTLTETERVMIGDEDSLLALEGWSKS